MEAMKAASLKLPINKQLGFAWIIPYKGTATFQIGYKGLIQLAMRTGLYKHLNAGPVYEGEFVSQDKLSGTVDLSGEATSDKVIGYFAHFKLLNGFERTMYWSKERVIAHASAYSQSYRSGNDIWKKNFDEMATKTLMRNLLKWAPLSVEFANSLAEDDLTDTTDIYVEEYTPDNYEVIDNG
jgi:recombination protein RecT